MAVPLPGSHFVRNLIGGRALLFQLIRRDFEQRYVGSAAGWLWGLIHPLVMLLSWTFVFQYCLRQEAPQGGPYPLYLMAGYLPWYLFQETVLRSAGSLVEQSNLITKTVFPSEIIPLSIFFSTLVNHLLTLALVLAAIIWTNGGLSLNLLVLPVYMLLAGMLAVGLGWIFSSLQVYLRDTAQALSVFLTLWFWMTPIFVSETSYRDFQFLQQWNPMAFLVRAYRSLLVNGVRPDWHELVILGLFSATVFLLGGLFFRHLKRGFADVL